MLMRKRQRKQLRKKYLAEIERKSTQKNSLIEHLTTPRLNDVCVHV